uniref:Transcription repressor n=1 Tax=Kalanchoe fedtschenkoi TaxID=63787 RepID=A0A7N0RI99_KALFE
MQKKPGSYFHDRISKIKKLWQHRHHHDGPPAQPHLPYSSSPLASILPTCVCQVPRLSFSEDDDADDGGVTKIDQSALSDLEWFLTQDFKSLLSKNEEEKPNDFKGANEKNNFLDDFSVSSYEYDHGDRIDITTSGDEEFIEVDDEILKNKMLAYQNEKCDAFYKCSYDPCDDFRVSMVEMVEFRFQTGGTIDWEFMEDLLACYLDMNDTSLHCYIIDAFVDVAVAVLQSSGSFPPAPKTDLTAREWARRR